MTQVCVIGSNSFSGASFCAHLLARGIDVLTLSRSIEPHEVFLPYRWKPAKANRAVYIFEPEVLDFTNKLGERVIDLSTEIIPAFMGRIAIFENRDYRRDTGTTESLERAHREYRPVSCPA